jgi:hypothetical protein
MEQAMMVDLTTAWARARDIVTAINREGIHHPALAKASQNMAASAMLLDTLPALSTNGVDRVYHRMKYILGIAATLQVESSLLCRAEVLISSLGRSKADRQKAATEPPMAWTTSSPA